MRTTACIILSTLTLASTVRAQGPVGAPVDESAAVAQQKAAAALEENKKANDSLAASINAGAQFATGNSQVVAISGGGKIDLRRGDNAFGAAMLANYAEGFNQPVAMTMTTAASPGAWKDTVRNVQGKLRYDRFFGKSFSAFLQVTGTHDAFQATTFRLNIDPGVKYLLVNEPKTKFWGEVGYDFEFDLNYTDGNGIEQTGSGGNAVDAMGLPFVIVKTTTMHSARAYLGFQHAFNKEVQFNTGLEFLQGFGGSGDGAPPIPPGFTAAQVDPVTLNLVRTRMNFDALLAAHVGAGLSIAAGFTLKYNSAPLPGKQDVDTTTTLSLIYAFASPAPGAPAATSVCPTPPPVSLPTSTPSIGDAATQHPIGTGDADTKTLSTGYALKAPAGSPERALVAFADDASKPATDAAWIDITDIDADANKDQLRNFAEIMKAYPNVHVAISAENVTRADSMRAALVSAGIAGDRVTSEARPGHGAIRITAK